MAASLTVLVTESNWREVRDDWAARMGDLGLDGVAEAFREIGWAERRGFTVDDAFCAKAVEAQAGRAIVAVTLSGLAASL